MWPWYLLGLVMIGAIMVRDNLPDLASWQRPADPVRKFEAKAITKPTATETRRSPPPTPDRRPSQSGAAKTDAGSPADEVTFFYCGIKQDNCILDGGNFIYRGATIRMADIYVPATKEAKCDRERLLGGDAKEALRVLLNAGKFELGAWTPINEDQFGRKLRIVRRDGRSIGDALIAKGLARPWAGKRESWCP